MSDDTLFQAGSISKSLTAWGILHLVDEGRLLLDDPVGKYLTKWKLPNSEFNNNEVTIRRLLSHTAGLSAHKGYLGVAPGNILILSRSLCLEKDGLMNQWKLPKPGSETIYSGGGYTILQLVMEEVTGISFDRYMEEQIMKPLGMKSSSFYNVLKTITFQKLMDILERSSLVTNLPNRLLQVLRQMLSI